MERGVDCVGITNVCLNARRCMDPFPAALPPSHDQNAVTKRRTVIATFYAERACVCVCVCAKTPPLPGAKLLNFTLTSAPRQKYTLDACDALGTEYVKTVKNSE